MSGSTSSSAPKAKSEPQRFDFSKRNRRKPVPEIIVPAPCDHLTHYFSRGSAGRCRQATADKNLAPGKYETRSVHCPWCGYWHIIGEKTQKKLYGTVANKYGEIINPVPPRSRDKLLK